MFTCTTFLHIKDCLKTVFTFVVKSKCFLYLKNKVAATYSKNRTISKS